MQFKEALRMLASDCSKWPLGGPHLLLPDARFDSDTFSTIIDFLEQFGLADNGLTIGCRLYQKTATLIQQKSPELIKKFDSGSLVFDSSIEANLADNLQVLAPDVKMLLGAQFYLAGLGDLILFTIKNKENNSIVIDYIESGINTLNQAHVLLPNESLIVGAIGIGTKMKQDAVEQTRTSRNSNGGEGSKGGGCFIATAAFDDEFAPEVIYLRVFRDKVLSKSVFGRAFISTYYLISPPIAKIISKSIILKNITKQAFLIPIINIIGTRYKVRPFTKRR